MSNKLPKIFFIFTLVLINLTFYPINETAYARAGGGGSGGGGSSGGGGLLGLIIVIPILIILYIQRQARIKKTKEKIAAAALSDKNWDKNLLTQKVEQVFNKFQQNWSDFNIEPMQEYLTDGYYKRMILHLNVLKNEHRRNIVSKTHINSIIFLEAHDSLDNNQDYFMAEINAQAQDILLDEVTNQPLYTDTSAFTEYWIFVRYNDQWKLDLIKQSTENYYSIDSDIKLFAKNNNFYYDPDFGWLMMPNKGLIFNATDFKESDINNHTVGYYRDKIVEFYNYIPYKKSNKNYLVAQTVLPKSYHDILVRKKRWLEFTPKGLTKFTLESNEFNKKFSVYAFPEDQVNSFELLTPNFMEKIYQLPFELNIEIVGNFLYFYTLDQRVSYTKMLEILSWAFDEMKQ